MPRARRIAPQSRPLRRMRVTLFTSALIGVLLLTGALALIIVHVNAGNGSSGRDAASLASCADAGRAACGVPTVPYAHSWYIDSAVDTPDGMARLGTQDAHWLVRQVNASACTGTTEFLTVLDFGHPTRAHSGSASLLDDYAMSVFGHQDSWRTYHQIEGLSERYLDAWIAAIPSTAVASCPRLYLALGTSNFAECAQAVGACDVNSAGQLWDTVVHDVAAYVAAKGYAGHIAGIWMGDDLETSWDPWATTEQFLLGVRDQERTYTLHARLVDYGDANVGACSEVTGSCSAPWTPQNVYAAAWGLGWAVPLPEAYNTATTKRWENVAAVVGTTGAASAQEPMAFLGAMTECGESDPLPTGACHPQGSTGAGRGRCEWSPAIAYYYLHATDPGHALAFATNIQWPDQPTSDQAGIQTSASGAIPPSTSTCL